MRSAPTARSEVRRTERAGRGNQIARLAGREHTQSRRSEHLAGHRRRDLWPRADEDRRSLNASSPNR